MMNQTTTFTTSKNSRSLSIRTVFLLLLLQNIQSIVKCASEDFYNPDYYDELKMAEDQNGIQDLPSTLVGNEMDKRYFGAVAALSGPRDRSQRQPMQSEILKRHLGSANYGAKQKQMQKKYFGSVASKSGFRTPTAIFSTGRVPSSDSHWLQEKRHVGAFAKMKSQPLSRVPKSFGVSEFSGTDLGESDEFYDYPVDTADSGLSPHYGFLEDPSISIKSKRFLGSLARVGWFPRQFRGVVADNPYDQHPYGKRHIGAAARVGWLPSSKFDQMEDGIGEGSGFKRNVASLKKVQFAAPSPWGRPREKRMSI